jgi:hypothetical protein
MYFNTAMGTNALLNLGPINLHEDSGIQNTAAGYAALYSNTTGSANTAVGLAALSGNTAGYGNTAVGASTLEYNTTGGNNSAFGLNALYFNTTGTNNTAVGYGALIGAYGDSGSNNTGIGYNALYSYTTGSNNTASGMNALYSTTTGAFNSAAGFQALYSNTTGSNNTASGVNALYDNTTGSQNTASGRGALQSNTTGSNNIAEGFQAGYNLTTGNDNIDIGNKGVAAESNTIRIGTAPTQNATYIAGITTAKVTGSAVYVTSTGQLGVLASSERFKTAIVPMGSNTAKLGQLRPVTFHLKTDPKGFLQYGLIAEEVAQVYPELVIRDESGRIDGLRYDELAPMLLNEMQQQHTQTTETINAQAAEIRNLRKEMAEMHAALLELRAKGNLGAWR